MNIRQNLEINHGIPGLRQSNLRIPRLENYWPRLHFYCVSVMLLLK